MAAGQGRFDQGKMSTVEGIVVVVDVAEGIEGVVCGWVGHRRQRMRTGHLNTGTAGPDHIEGHRIFAPDPRCIASDYTEADHRINMKLEVARVQPFVSRSYSGGEG